MSQVSAQYFENRFTPVEATLLIWGVRAFPSKGELDRDEALQHARIIMWKKYTEDPNHWKAQPALTWTAYAKACYESQILHQKIVERLTDSAEDMIQDDFDHTGEEALSAKINGGRHQYPAEIELTDKRIDLERGLIKGFEQLPERHHADMRHLMSDIMEGYTQNEIKARHGWSINHTKVLYKHLWTTFYEALTGEKHRPCEYGGCKSPATNEEITKLYQLRQEGLSYNKCGAMLGRSGAWAEKTYKLQPLPRKTPSEKEQERNDRIEEILYMMDDGMNMKAIAAKLNISYNTVRRLLGKI